MSQANPYEIIDEILDDLVDRRDLGDAWLNIDSDIQDEIREIWVRILDKYL